MIYLFTLYFFIIRKISTIISIIIKAIKTQAIICLGCVISLKKSKFCIDWPTPDEDCDESGEIGAKVGAKVGGASFV